MKGWREEDGFHIVFSTEPKTTTDNEANTLILLVSRAVMAYVKSANENPNDTLKQDCSKEAEDFYLKIAIIFHADSHRGSSKDNPIVVGDDDV